MAKETFFFPHDYEPTSDPKIQALIGEYGGLGYGIYWRVVEMLHSDDTHKLPLKPYLFLAIAKQMQANAEQIQAIINYCIKPCELFVSDDNFFISNRVDRNIERRAEISKIRSEAGHKGAIAKQMQANAQQNLANTSKEKYIKEKKNKDEYISPEKEGENIDGKIFTFFDKNFKPLDDFLRSRLSDDIEHYGAEKTLAALVESKLRGKPSLGYAEEILKTKEKEEQEEIQGGGSDKAKGNGFKSKKLVSSDEWLKNHGMEISE